jgi:threonine synthase
MLECVYPAGALTSLDRPPRGGGMNDFLSLLPLKGPLSSLGEGGTPLLRSQRLGKILGLSGLYFKDESRNPTGSFKDREMSIAVTKAREAETNGVIIASSGNAAASLSAYSAASSMTCFVLVDRGVPASKLKQILLFGAKCVRVENIFGQGPEKLFSILEHLADRLNLWVSTPWQPINPYSVEGVKTISYELVSSGPDVIVCPVSGGDNLAGQWKGWKELLRAELIKKLPKMVGVQPSRSAPLVQAYQRGERSVRSIDKCETVASGLRTTFSGDHALRAVYESGGAAISVEDSNILKYQALLAQQEGIWVEPSSAITLAALPLLLESRTVKPEESIVCILTGAGYKDMEMMLGYDKEVPTAILEPKDIMEKIGFIPK